MARFGLHRWVWYCYGKSSAQIIIRWHLQAGNIAIPGSSNEKHIIEDASVWNFTLIDSEMRQMAALEKKIGTMPII